MSSKKSSWLWAYEDTKENIDWGHLTCPKLKLGSKQLSIKEVLDNEKYKNLRGHLQTSLITRLDSSPQVLLTLLQKPKVEVNEFILVGNKQELDQLETMLVLPEPPSCNCVGSGKGPQQNFSKMPCFACKCYQFRHINEGLLASRTEFGFSECTLNCHCDKGKCTNNRITRKLIEPLEVRDTGTSKGLALYTLRDCPPFHYLNDYYGELSFNLKKSNEFYSFERTMYLDGIQKRIHISPLQKGNIMLYMNHSCRPNCELINVNADGEIHFIIQTNRRVKAGDELTIDYGRYFFENSPHLICSCGEKECRYKGRRERLNSQQKQRGNDGSRWESPAFQSKKVTRFQINSLLRDISKFSSVNPVKSCAKKRKSPVESAARKRNVGGKKLKKTIPKQQGLQRKYELIPPSLDLSSVPVGLRKFRVPSIRIERLREGESPSNPKTTFELSLI